jgi:sulfatase maturation enzyme AslB (radical SAM superfamily)
MANLMITTACNFRCPYCFGLDLFGPGQARQYMPLKLFQEIIAWIDRAAMTEMDIHLMGGEPTLHPAFGDMVEELVRRGWKTAVFSNAATPLDDVLVRRTADLGVSWIVNCNPPTTYRDNQLELLCRHLGLLRQAATITFNFTDGQTPYQYVFDYIEHYSLKHAIKLGVALPTLEHRNVCAEWDNLPSIGRHILELLREARRRQITVEFECAVPYCLFSEEQHGELRNIHVSHCGSRLDITPTGEVINCLPLFRIASVPFDRFQNYRQAREWFQCMLAPYRQAGSTSRCLFCQYRLEGRCSACLAYGLGEYSRIPLPPLPTQGLDDSAEPGLTADRKIVT